MASTKLWRPAVVVKTRVWMRCSSRGLIKPGLGTFSTEAFRFEDEEEISRIESSKNILPRKLHCTFCITRNVITRIFVEGCLARTRKRNS